MTVYAYLRVSTGKQDVDNQRFEIENYAKRNGLKIDEWRADNGISGTVDYRKRKIGTIIDECKEGDIIIISEISRLGRKLLMIMEELNKIMQRGCVVYSAFTEQARKLLSKQEPSQTENLQIALMCLSWFSIATVTSDFSERYVDCMLDDEARKIWMSLHGEQL